MATALLDRKLDRAFGHLDVDGNGQIERDDLVGLGVRILSGFGASPTSAQGKELVGSFQDVWDALVAEIDTDGDARLSLEEYRRGMVGAFAQKAGGFDRAFRPAAVATLQLADTDGDGVMTQAEFRTMQEAFGTSAGDIEAAFGKLDADGTGTLTVEELVEAARQFYTGENPDAPGNWLFGPI